MALMWYASVDVDEKGQVGWHLLSGTASEALGFARIDSSARVGSGGPDDGSGVREANLLIALECLGSKLLDASRNLAWSYSLLPVHAVQVGRTEQRAD